MTIKDKTIFLTAEDVAQASEYRKSEIQEALELAGYTVVFEEA